MAQLYDINASSNITNIVESCELNIEPNQIVQYSISGDTYMQIIGGPKKKYSVVCYVVRSGISSLEQAWANGNKIRVMMSHGTYYGYIMDLTIDPVFDHMNLAFDGKSYKEYFKVELTLAYTTS